jgi:N-acetyl-alpha-D-glucosaminyl L-malate synthase BshA
MVDTIKFEKLDILHVHYAIPHASAAFIAQQILKDEGINIPFITTLHGTDITLVGKDPMFSPVVTFAINHSNGVTTVSESLRNDTFENFNIKRPIEVIPNFIDFSRFSKKNKEHFRQLIAPNGEKILMHVSNFRPVKRVEDVIYVFKQVRDKMNCKLLLIGDGPERNNVENICRNIGYCDDIRFLGKQDAIEELLAIADVFILPSEKESFGLAALEAMACEVPVISSNTGGLAEINIQGKTGFLSDVGDVDDMARNVLKILADEATHNAFRKAALAQARKFEIKNILPMYEAYYDRVLSGVPVL